MPAIEGSNSCASPIRSWAGSRMDGGRVAEDEESAAVPPRPAPRRLVRALVADDDPGARNLLSSYFQERGFEVTQVENGEDALYAAWANRFRVIVLDAEMPRMGGIQALGAIRMKDVLTPIVITSDTGSMELLDQAFQLGANEFMVKPLARDHLEQRLSRFE